VARAVEALEPYPFDCVDINMGFSVRKVIGGGSGAAMLNDVDLVRRTVALARQATGKPLSAKIRLGWDHLSRDEVRLAQVIEAAGADFITVHGRTRADSWGDKVDLEGILRVKRAVRIPVVGNGNLFSRADAAFMQEKTGVDGLMVARGALGYPWLFREIAGGPDGVSVAEWRATVIRHIALQRDVYGEDRQAAMSMRKVLHWYTKGWPGIRAVNEAAVRIETLDEAKALVETLADRLEERGTPPRRRPEQGPVTDRFTWDT
jgi:tRNA-dihydrouridine synthase B